MADIELVIKINEEVYRLCKGLYDIDGIYNLEIAVKYGTPLPKGHGRLIDVDEIPGDGSWDFSDRLDETPTIIEADKESEDRNE